MNMLGYITAFWAILLLQYLIFHSSGLIPYRICGGTDRADMSDEKEDNSTAMLIGQESYDAMVKRVDELTARHSHDRCVLFRMTASCCNDISSHVLHMLLPGDRLILQKYRIGDMDCVAVYSRGVQTGSLMLDDAETYLSLAVTRRVTGAYVARQNCYQRPQSLDIELIVYYNPSASRRQNIDSNGKINRADSYGTYSRNNIFQN